MSQNTAGSRPEKLSITEAAKMVKLEDFKTIHQKPCVRESLLAGIAGGFGVGGLRLIFGSTSPFSPNYT
jgi:cytochrome c oxidase assembly protein subunit 20